MESELSLYDFFSAVSRSLILLIILLTLPFIKDSNSITFELMASTLALALMSLICSASFILIFSSLSLAISNSMPLLSNDEATGRDADYVDSKAKCVRFATLYHSYFSRNACSTTLHWTYARTQCGQPS